MVGTNKYMEIKLDKSTLPEDLRRVKFLEVNKDEWIEAIYHDSEELFQSEDGKVFVWAHDVVEWEYI